jgi:lipopolysaccharide/colanic/teichoic acid biosynthesis glycosyltransferase/O-antigen ligase
MSTTALQPGRILPRAETSWRVLRYDKADAIALGLALCAVPVSIAIAETLLAVGLALRVSAVIRHQAHLRVPRIFWFWLIWAVIEAAAWLYSPDIRAGQGEIRHLLLVAALFVMLPALDRPRYAITIWRGIIFSATLSSVVLIGDFMSRLVRYGHELSSIPDPSYYLRSGGLLNHWMIYGTVEVMVFAALLEFWPTYPEERRYLLPLFALNCVAILLSLTRMLWVACLLLLFVHLAWRHSKWIWTAPAWPVLLFVLAPGPVRFRVTGALQPSYYSNAERLQMLGVGAKMIRDAPLTGIGPGRVETLYRSYLSPGDAVPAYHGHLHNNLFQLAAEFGLPAVFAAVLFVAVLFKHLRQKLRSAPDRDAQFLCRTALLGLMGFLAAGMFDYTYGHSLGLILLSFVAIAPLVSGENARADSRDVRSNTLALLDRAAGASFFLISLIVLIPAAVTTIVLSRRSPFIAHLRIGKDSHLFWVWKLRTMWPRNQAASAGETGWVQRIDCDPQTDQKPETDPRITSRFARFCRRHSIDELPQFFHVMRGQMSLVGPRPLTRTELVRHYGARAEEILSLKPGLTGYWQTRGRSRLSYPERVALDLELVRDLSVRVYFQLLLRTIPALVSGKDAW